MTPAGKREPAGGENRPIPKAPKSRVPRVAAILLFAWLTTVSTAWPAGGAKAEASRLFEKRDFSGAAAALQKHLQSEPNDRDGRVLLGICRYQLGQNYEAEQVFQEVLHRHPQDAQAYFYLGLTRLLLSKFSQAEADARKSVELGAPKARSIHLIGRIQEENHRLEEALESYRSALAEDPDYAAALLSAGQVLLKLRRSQESISYLAKATQADTESADAYYHLGRAYLAARRAKEAAKSLQAAVRLGHASAGGLLARTLSALVAPAKASPPPLPTPPPSKVPVRFRDVSAAAGVTFVLQNHPTAEKHLIETMAGGVAAFDYDNDGLVDIFFTNGAKLPSLKKTDSSYHNRLYRNQGGMKFADVTARAGLQGSGFSTGVAAADYDNDGDIDLFVAALPAAALYRNRGDGSFEPVTDQVGIKDAKWPIAAGWFDYDNDGRLDLFIVSYLDWSPQESMYCGDRKANFRTYCHPKFFNGTRNGLYRNNGDGSFEDVSNKAGISDHIGKGMSVAFADYDDNGFVDVFVTNDAVPNFLFHNNGDGTFREVGLEAGPALTDDGKAVSAMGVDFRDYNNDQLPDIVFTALWGETFPVFRNQGGGFFQDATYQSKVGVLSANRSGWGVGLADLNNDGWKDLFVTNSHVTDNVERFSDTETYKQSNSVWLNQGDGSFADGSLDAGEGFSVRAAHRGSAITDLNNDGRLDIVVASLGGAAEVWENVTPKDNHWLGIRLRGTKSNRDGIGARIQVRGQSNLMTSSVGYASSSHGPVHFGLGPEEGPVSVEILWPSGIRQVVEGVEIDQAVTFEELAQEVR